MTCNRGVGDTDDGERRYGSTNLPPSHRGCIKAAAAAVVGMMMLTGVAGMDG